MPARSAERRATHRIQIGSGYRDIYVVRIC
jgi:hypothetical protein